MTQKTEKTFADLIAEVTDANALAMTKVMALAMDARMEFEHREHPGNDTIQTKLRGARAKLTAPSVVKALVAAGVDPTFVNRSLVAGRRFNIYAVEKLADLLRALGGDVVKVAVNMAVVQSLFRCAANGIDFTAAIAQAAVSDKIKVDPKIAKVLVRHTVAPGTAATQASSTMSALEQLGVVQNKGTHKFPVYHLTDKPVVAHLKQVVGA